MTAEFAVIELQKTKLNVVVTTTTTVEFRNTVNIVVTLPSWNPTFEDGNC